MLERTPIGSAVMTVVASSGATIGPGLPSPAALCVHIGGALMAMADLAHLSNAPKAERGLREFGMTFMAGAHDTAAGRLLGASHSSVALLESLLEVQWAITAAVLALGADHEAATVDHITQRLSMLGPDGKGAPRSQWAFTPDWVQHMPHHVPREARRAA